jgi:predicted secreted protein
VVLDSLGRNIETLYRPRAATAPQLIHCIKECILFNCNHKSYFHRSISKCMRNLIMNSSQFSLATLFTLLILLYTQANANDGLASCSGPTLDTTHQNSTKSLTSPISLWKVDNLSLTRGQNFTIYIESNPSVGDNWNVSFDSNLTSLLGQNFKSTSIEQPPPPGGGGILYFTFQGENVGNSILNFQNNFRGHFIKDTKLINVSVTC